MGNNYFRFKQFNINQGECAMKVTTDACILGAWAPILPGTVRALDIGCGTGLLSLMLSQRNPDLLIEGIEIDKQVAQQAQENCANSLWHNKINIIEGDVRNALLPNIYDLIVTNPPFFNNSLLSDNKSKNYARHNNTLSNNDLLRIAENNLKKDGYLSILLPLPEYKIFESFLIENNWNVFRKLLIKHKENSGIKRVIGLFSKSQLPGQEDTLVIYNDNNTYSTDFVELMAPYYLKL